MTEQLNESLQYLDMERQVVPNLSIDKYESKIGDNSDYVTAAFTMNSKEASDDLCSWLERGYDWVVDAETSPGEVIRGKYLVFVEMNRRTSVPKRIIELLDDLETLTALPVKDWTIIVDDEEYSPEEDVLKQVITISPHEYRETEEVEEKEINEMRERAGLEVKAIHADKQDADIKAFKSMAGL